jgi:NADPH:quinone reductase-like Zn-dependent oxidoreductase
MKAIVFHQHGAPDVLKYEDAPDPAIRPNEVLVRVKACALNHLDLWVRRGNPNIPIPLPHIPGSDVSGEIAQIGADVTTVRVGQKVVLAPGVTCGKCSDCVSGQDNRCRQFTNLGYLIDGGCAELVHAPEVNCMPYPENLTFEEAASIPLVFQTAWHMLLTRAELQPGEDVLILGASSGVGSAAIQVAKFFGARVLATAGSDVKLEKAKQLGADHLINHKTQKIRDEVRRITNKRGVDVVFEHVGTATWDESFASLAPGGRLVTCGATTGYSAPTWAPSPSSTASCAWWPLGVSSPRLTVFSRSPKRLPPMPTWNPARSSAKSSLPSDLNAKMLPRTLMHSRIPVLMATDRVASRSTIDCVSALE